MSFFFSRVIDSTVEASIDRVASALAKEGFGILTRIDVKKTLKEKLDVDFRNYHILGACNPFFSHKALEIEDKVGTMLPCNVVVQETPEGKTEVAAVDPMASMIAIENDELRTVAKEVRSKIRRVMDSL